MRPETGSLIVVALIGSFSAGCASSAGKLDLVPAVRPDAVNQVDWCIQSQRVGVRVRNFGTTPVMEVPIRVTFSFGGNTPSETKTTPSGETVPSGGGYSSTVEFAIPTGCFDSDCNFTIEVDPDRKFPELNRGNNTVQAVCVG